MEIDLSTQVGSVLLPYPVLTAAGTSGHGAELHSFFDLSRIGAVVTKSTSARPHKGNPPARVHELRGGMINAVGNANHGMEAWIKDELPRLRDVGARVIPSIWGYTVGEYEEVAQMLRDTGPEVVAVEVNISCPNTEAGGAMFAHDCVASAEAIAATAVCGKPRWAKLSPNTTEIVNIARSVVDAGAEAVTLTNTLIGMMIDTENRRPFLSNQTGGVSGAALHAVALRCAYQVHAAHPDIAIVGAGGVANGNDAVEFFMAGASAVEVGTAIFANPKAPINVVSELEKWLLHHEVGSIREIVGAAQVPYVHGAPTPTQTITKRQGKN